MTLDGSADSFYIGSPAQVDPGLGHAPVIDGDSEPAYTSVYRGLLAEVPIWHNAEC